MHKIVVFKYIKIQSSINKDKNKIIFFLIQAVRSHIEIEGVVAPQKFWKKKKEIYIFGIILINLKFFKEPLSFWPSYLIICLYRFKKYNFHLNRIQSN